jgi:ankyrin repeat protein
MEDISKMRYKLQFTLENSTSSDFCSTVARNGNVLQAAAASYYDWNDKTLKQLLDRGADVNEQGGRYGNALQAAAAYITRENVLVLLEHGADVNAQGGEHGTALQAACKSDTSHGVGVIHLLLARG